MCSHNDLGKNISLPLTIPVYYFGPLLHYGIKKFFNNVKYSPKYLASNSPNNNNSGEHMSPSQINSEFRRDLSAMRTYSMDYHVCMILMIVYLILANTLSSSSQSCPVDILNIFCYACMPFSMLMIYLEIFLSYEFRYLWNLSHEKPILEFLRMLIKTQPSITMRTTCWHYESRQRVVNQTVNNTTTTYIETCQVKVIDKVTSKLFSFKRWSDTSAEPNTLPLDKSKVTRIKVIKVVLFGNNETKNEFNRQRDEMIHEGKLRYPGRFVDFEREDDIAGFKSRLASY